MREGDQFSLFGEAPTPARRPKPKVYPKGENRLLFALYPDPQTAARIAREGAALRTTLGLTGRPRPVDVLHVTLRHIGDFVGPPPEVVEALIAALAGFDYPAFEVTLAAATRFAGSRAVVLLAPDGENPALVQFQRALCERLDDAGAGWRAGGAGFTPHVTLSYDDSDVPVRPIAPIAWTAREFVLIHSLLGQTRHIPVARLPLVYLSPHGSAEDQARMTET